MRVFVLEGRGRGTTARELVVLIVGEALQTISFARKVIGEAEAASDWFVFLHPEHDLVKENIDGRREKCLFKGDGFTLPDGGDFKFERAYTPAQFSTVWKQTTGAEVGAYLKAG